MATIGRKPPSETALADFRFRPVRDSCCWFTMTFFPSEIHMSERLVGFRQRIEGLLPVKTARPFTCSGSPYDCAIFIVGVNSATQLGNEFFQRYWSDESGFLRDTFEADYSALRKKKGVRPRIEALVAGARPTPCLETNIYCVPTRKASQLRASDKTTAVFEALIEEIKPIIVLAHSNEPIEYFAQFAVGPISLDEPVSATIGSHTFQVIGWHGPLFTKSIDAARKVGEQLSSYCGAE
jgi:hypothetical protein